MNKKLLTICCLLLLSGSICIAQRKLTVQAGRPVTAVPATMWGIFFEDINFGADGGLYAELVKNRSFEFTTPMMGWREAQSGGGNGKLMIVNEAEDRPRNPRYLRLSVNAPSGAYGLSNEGFRGMGFRAGEPYSFSLLARRGSGDLKLTVELVSASGKKLASTSLQGFTQEWKKHSVSLTPSDSAARGRLQLWLEGSGSLDADMISLFPQSTWKGRTNGLRADLVQWLADLKPGFIRFPGGCIVEGITLENRYQWKNTVGPADERRLIMNRWNVEFPRRAAPDYFQTFGLGFYEYFLLSEDVGAEPLPIINCGMACQYNSGEVASMNNLEPFIQDALDLIEFANGPVTSQWGKVRAGMGHPAPFGLKFLGVGNEQWEEQYIERYKEFEKVLKKRHPEIKLVAAAGPAPDGPRFEYAWRELRKLNADLIDEHYYKSPEWFLQSASRYDQYDRKGPKVFAGEFAAHGQEDPRPESKNTWMSALSEAAFMTGLERNADVVQMASYAPLLAHVDAWQWRPDLIWFDNLRSVGTPNYYVQKLFANNRGTDVVPVLENGLPLAGKDSLYASSTLDKKTHEVVIKLVNVSAAPVACNVELAGVAPAAKRGTVQILSAPERWAVNTLDNPRVVYPVERAVIPRGKNLPVTLPPLSLNVIRIGVK